MGEVPRKCTAAKLQVGAVHLNYHLHQAFLLQAFPLQKIQVLMIVRLDTTHASPAWRSTGRPTSSIGAARRRIRDARATHHCTCRSHEDFEYAQGYPYLPACSICGSIFVYAIA